MKISMPYMAAAGVTGIMIYATLASIVNALMEINQGYLPVWNAGISLFR